MSKIHFMGGEKGGVGKSVLSRLLAQYYIDRKVAFKVFDADLSHGAMMRYYSDYSEPVDITRFDNADSIAEHTIEAGVDTIVDLAAQAARPLNQWVKETGLPELADEIGLKLFFWHVMDDGADSLQLLNQLLDDYGEHAEVVIACNYGRGNDFSHLQDPKIVRKIEDVQARVIDIPALHAPAMRKIDHISASFWAAANNSDSSLGPTLGLLERQRVKTWVQKTYAQFDRLGLDK